MLVALFSAGLSATAWAETVNLRFSWWGSATRHERMIKAIHLFERQNPGVKVTPEYMAFTGYYDRLTTQMVVGKEPDLMMINWAWLPILSRQGDGFYDLYGIRSQLKLDEYSNESYKAGLVHGKLNGLNAGQNARVFLWQKHVFDKAGISIPQTWDELLSSGKVFEQRLGKDYYPLHLGLYDAILVAHAYILQRTGKPYVYANQAKVGLSQDEALDWVHFYRRLFLEHVTSYMGASDNLESLGEQSPAWLAGKLGGSYAWSSLLPTRIAALPKGARPEVGPFLTMPGAKNSGMFGRPSSLFSVSKHSKKPELAAKLATFLLTSPEGVRTLYPSFGFAQTHHGYDAIKGRISIQERDAFEQINKLHPDYPSPLFEHPKVQAFLRDIFRALAQGKMDEREAAQRLLIEGNQLLRTIH